MVVFAVSGHCLFDCGTPHRNDEYLFEQGTAERLLQMFDQEVVDAIALDYADSFYNYDEDGAFFSPPRTVEWPYQYGFLMLLRELAEVRDRYIWGAPQAARIMVICHSHGCVWAHLALMLVPDVPVDVLISLDGESLGWRGDGLAGLAADNWRDVIDAYEYRTGVEWPFGVDASDPADAFRVPGIGAPQDIEDIAPANVDLNLEVSGTWSVTGIHDGDPNWRLDGSQRDIISIQVDESHSDLDAPYSEAMDWVVREVSRYYWP